MKNVAYSLTSWQVLHWLYGHFFKKKNQGFFIVFLQTLWDFLAVKD